MNITVLERGGFSVHGGSYDARRNLACSQTISRQTVTVTFPAALTSARLATDGVIIGAPVVVGSVVTFSAEGLGRVDVEGIGTAADPVVCIEFGPYRTGSARSSGDLFQDYSEIFEGVV